MRRTQPAWCLGLTLAVLALPAAASTRLDDQRTAFRAAHQAAELGDWDPAVAHASLLEDYILWPDLRAAYLRTQLSTAETDVRRYLRRYGDLKPARELRYRYALHLARQKRDADYLELYDTFYSKLGEASLDCFAAVARQRQGEHREAAALGLKLWQVGRSQVKQCDAIFETLRRSGELTAERYAERYMLAVDAQEFSLARYLARSLDADTLAEANRWLRAQRDAGRFLALADVSRRDTPYHEQLAYAARRLGYSQPLEARAHWQRLSQDLRFSASLSIDVERYLALWAARRHLPEARQLLDTLAPEAVDDEVRRWQVRSALRQHDWQSVLAYIDALPSTERQHEEWRYWRGIAHARLGATDDAADVLRDLADERTYYGFLAADHLKLDYSLRSSTLAVDEATIAELDAREDIARARELFHVGLNGRARSEWDAAVSELSDHEKTQAALLADRWQWHSRAIATVAKTGEYDDLNVRYPLPHRQAFQRSATESGVRESWAYGVARSESLFMRDVRSSAGAIGLMQLMPGTGRDTAREIKHPYRGMPTLTDPDSNIRLGTRYLAKMHKQFDRHPALATAAYNAGPRRVSAWLPEDRPMDARIWVETIPFNETRRYVRRVLASDVIFHWRITGKTQRLSQQLPRIAP